MRSITSIIETLRINDKNLGEKIMKNNFYNDIKSILINARNKVYKTANFAMVEAYWNIGKIIIDEQGGKETAEYGQGLLQELSNQMTKDFGKGFTVTNLKYMRQFYLTFPNCHALRDELSWTHYRSLMRVENEKAREFYLDLPEDEKQIFASKYKLYLPSEEELLNELNREYLSVENYEDKEKHKN